jgi:SSS family solute:Na+ symporter
MLYLRMAVGGVAVFAFCFSSFFRQTQYIQLYWQATGAILSGAGAVTIGGLYWKKGTTSAAWLTIAVGATIALTGMVLQQMYPDFTFYGQYILHGQYVSLFTILASSTTYIIVSLLTCREDYNMDRMLHRGKYAVEGEEKKVAPPLWKRFNPIKLIGIDEEYTFWDRVIALSIFGWIWSTLVLTMVGAAWNFIHPWSTATWLNWWLIFGLSIPFAVSIVTTIWFTIGGVREIRVFFRHLRVEKINVRDDGTVGPGHP